MKSTLIFKIVIIFNYVHVCVNVCYTGACLRSLEEDKTVLWSCNHKLLTTGCWDLEIEHGSSERAAKALHC